MHSIPRTSRRGGEVGIIGCTRSWSYIERWWRASNWSEKSRTISLSYVKERSTYPVSDQTPRVAGLPSVICRTSRVGESAVNLTKTSGSVQNTVMTMTASANVQPPGLLVCYAVCLVVMLMAVSIRSISSRRSRGKSGSNDAWIYVALVCVCYSRVLILQLTRPGLRNAVSRCWLCDNIARDYVSSAQRHLRGPSISSLVS